MIEVESEVVGSEDTVTTEGVTDGLDMETDRLLYDDGRTWSRRAVAANSQGHRGAESRAAIGPDAPSHMRQRNRGLVLALPTLPQA